MAVRGPLRRIRNPTRRSAADLGALDVRDADRRIGGVTLPGPGGVGAGGGREGSNNDGKNEQATADHVKTSATVVIGVATESEGRVAKGRVNVHFLTLR